MKSGAWVAEHAWCKLLVMKLSLLIIVAALLHSPALFAGDPDPEIDHLLEAIGDSGCIFIRNGTRHDAEKAEDHLRMKYDRGRRYATSAETFIETSCEQELHDPQALYDGVSLVQKRSRRVTG